MRGKLTIRRVGTHIPAICLVGLLFLCLVITWLSLVGLPGGIIDKVEELAAQQGIHLKIKSLRLAPSRGLALKVDSPQIYCGPNDEQPLIKAKSATVSVSFFRLLFRGELFIDSVRLKKGNILLPISDCPGQHLNLSNIELVTTIAGNGDIYLSTASLNLQGIAMRFSGTIPVAKITSTDAQPEVEEKTDDLPLDLAALLAEYAPYIDKVYHVIDEQNWSNQEAPNLHIQLKGNDKLGATLIADVPRYDVDIFHFRNTRADISYSNDTLTINSLSFDTIAPPSVVTLKGAYESALRNLAFDFKSNAALIPMAVQFLGKENAGILSKLHHASEDAPQINLRGNISFEPDFSLSKITLSGELKQNNLYVNDTRLDRVWLEFYYRDGNFNLNNLHVQFKDNEISLAANANKGIGSALLTADVNVSQTLALVNEFTSTPLTIPDELKLGERLKLNCTADLTTPLFEPGQTDWQHFTPNLHNAKLQISLDRLAYANYEITEPTVSLALDEVQQTHNKLPEEAKKVQLAISAAGITGPGNLAINSLNLTGEAAEISWKDDILSIQELNLTSREAPLADNASYGDFSVNAPGLTLNLTGIRYTNGNVDIEAGNMEIAATGIAQDKLRIDNAHLSINQLEQLSPMAAELDEILGQAHLAIAADGIQYDDNHLGKISLQTRVTGTSAREVQLMYTPTSATDNRLTMNIDWSNLSDITFRDLELDAAPASFSGLLAYLGVDIPHIKLPEKSLLKGNVAYDATESKLKSAQFTVNIPELVRTPYKIKGFKGQQIPIGINADVHVASTEQGDTAYTADLKVTHGSDLFTGKIDGNSKGIVKVKGNNTIRADIVDRLIDSQTAHGIIRDFYFGPGGRNVITDIDVTVDYSEGLSVDSFCNVELFNTEYLLSVIEEDAQGNEKLRTDLGKHPYSMAKHATCYVRSKVRYDVVHDGRPVKDECAITIGNIDMTYNNKPWFARQKMGDVGLSSEQLAAVQKRHATSRMKGEAVIIDVENSFVELVNISGVVYPAYSIGMYYAPLQHFLADLVLPYPAKIETKSCVFPIYSDCTRAMSGLIKVEAAEQSGFRFLGTTIPLTNFSGFIRITDDYVMLDKMNAESWEGVLNADVKIDFSGKRTAFDGNVTASNMNLKSILASYGTKFSSALCNGHIRFRSPTPDVNDVQAYGSASIVNGDLMGFTIFQPVGSLVSDLPSKLLLFESAAKNQEESENSTGYIATVFSSTGDAISNFGNQAKNIPGYNHLFAYDLQNAHADFIIANGHLKAYKMKATGYNLNVDMKMDIDMESMYLKGNIWPKITSIPTIMLSPITFLSDFMIDILIYGEIDDLKWKFGLDRRLQGDLPSVSSSAATEQPAPRAKKKKN
ncbi:MAG: hypothetical protein IKZ13_01585 [Akkermansia sp.]|nr:hypothetical protein [Akkermansia sp.]